MYKISVPLMLLNIQRSDKEELLQQLKNLDAERVFLALHPYGSIDQENRDRELTLLKEHCAFFQENGYEVGVWLWAFMIVGDNDFVHMTGVSGKPLENNVCPSDESFREMAGAFIAKLAECGVDMIMFDDDFRYGFIGEGFNCLCENHLKKISKILEEPVTRELMKEKLLSGGGNKYRDAFQRANGYWLERFAQQMRDCIDQVNPNIRLGYCTGMSSWDIDGTTPDRLSRIMAGKTKPFYRLIGGPYWAPSKLFGNRIQDVIELERMESSWRQDAEIEIFCEGDAYPRPRWQVPAAFLEGFDTAMRAAACTDGILKYALDYTSGVRYEQGYAKRHMHSKALYEKIEQSFADKDACGVRVYEAPQQYATQEIYERVAGSTQTQDVFFSPAARMLACCAVPSVYEGSGVCGIAFGENARYLPVKALEGGLILDIEAARILQQRGIDTGIKKIGESLIALEEYFISEDEYVSVKPTFSDNFTQPSFRRVELCDGAEVQSLFNISEDEVNYSYIASEEGFPASYFYENENRQRFLVFTFEAYFNSEQLRRQYTRARQLAEAVKRLSGRALPAEATDLNPDLYMMCKEKDRALSVGLWNFSEDTVFEPEIKLAKHYDNIEFINCSGRLEGNRVFLSNIVPYSFAGFEVK